MIMTIAYFMLAKNKIKITQMNFSIENFYLKKNC